MSRWFVGLAITLGLMAGPARAQIFWAPPELTSPPILAPETGFGVLLPGATLAENQAALTWNLRSGLNVAALQCGFDPMLRIDKNYNSMLMNHREELASAFTTLTNYFKRRAATPKAGQTALDQYGTRTYSQFSAVVGQLAFCQTAGRVSNLAIFAPRSKLHIVAQERLRELYRSVQTPGGEQQFRPTWLVMRRPPIPDMRDSCWKKNRYSGCSWQ